MEGNHCIRSTRQTLIPRFTGKRSRNWSHSMVEWRHFYTLNSPIFLISPFSRRGSVSQCAILSSIAGSFLGEMSCSCWLGCCCTVHKSFEVSTSAETPRPRDRAKWNYVWRNRRLLYLNDTKMHIICSQRRRPHPAKPWCERKKSTAFPEYI